MNDFSVLMPVYWREDPNRLHTAISSVYANSCLPRETIIVCDGPLTDPLNRVLSSFCGHSGFRLLRLDDNQGIVSALNYGLKEVSSEIVVRCDSDDVSHPDRFQKLLSKIDEGFDVVGSQIEELDAVLNLIAYRELPIDHAAIVSFAQKRNPLNHMSVAYRRSSVLAVGGYPNVFLKEDYALWAKMIGAGMKFANLSESLVTADAGIRMYARRGGWRAALSEVTLQHTLVDCGISRPLNAFIVGLARSIVLLSPRFIRSSIYRLFLRHEM